MNRWRKLLVLWLLCVTMPLQAMAALRTHCAPGMPASTMTPAAAQAPDNAATAIQGMQAIHRAIMNTTIASHGDAMPGMAASDSAALDPAQSHPMAHADRSSDSAASHDSHSQPIGCSACAACAICTALAPSGGLRTPDAQPSTPIPFLRTSSSSAIVAVPERPPKARTA